MFVSVKNVGGPIRTRGCVVCAYPTPPVSTEIEVTVPLEIVAVAVALCVVPNPTGF